MGLIIKKKTCRVDKEKIIYSFIGGTSKVASVIFVILNDDCLESNVSRQLMKGPDLIGP